MKKLMSVLLALVMTVGLGSVAFAANGNLTDVHPANVPVSAFYESRWDEDDSIVICDITKTGNNLFVNAYQNNYNGLPSERVNIEIELKNGKWEHRVGSYFKADILTFVDGGTFVGEMYVNGEKMLDSDIESITEISLRFFENTNETPKNKIYFDIYQAAKVRDEYNLMYEAVPMEEVDKTPTPQNLSTAFATTVKTESGQYDMAIAGYIEKDLTNGANALTAQEINAQPISIVVHNNNTGENRVMTQSTIEEMTVNVSGGQITNITFLGRVQTAGGTLERYTTTINI